MAITSTPRALRDRDAATSHLTPEEDIGTVVLNQISWGAVFAGVVTALALHIILNLLGLGFGAAVLDPGTADNPDAETFSGIAALWWTVSGILASLVGGYVAGRTSGKPKESTAGFHGLASWATTTLVIFVMLTGSASTILGGIYGTVSSVVAQNADSAAGAAAQTPNPVDALRAEAQKMTGQDPANPSPETKQQTAQAAEKTAKVVSIGAVFAAIALLVGALAAWVGGRMGAVDPTLTAVRVTRRDR
jgi:hypothetical protein